MNISIVLACHNSDISKLNLTIQSIFNQTYKEFELILIDDGSDVPISGFLHIADERVKIYRIDTPSGLGTALNFGISKSSGKYIARIDDDDIMCTNRLELQFNYLENHPNIVCLGTHLFFKVGNKVLKHRKFPIDNDSIVRDLVKIKFSMAHTSIMFRKFAFMQIGGYRIKRGGQDLDLFLQFSTIGKLANLDEYLNYYTLSNNGLSVKYPQSKSIPYIFALSEFNKDFMSKIYENSINKTIYYLQKNSRINAIKVRLKRLLLIYYVRICGKHFTPLINT
jgi:glycosyltransferase involved in cell wall biosynthesis